MLVYVVVILEQIMSSIGVLFGYDIVKKTSKTVFERSFSELSGDERDKASVVPMSIFGDKVLFSVRCSYQKSGKTIEISEIWLVDGVNGQKRLLTKIQSLETGFYCHFSEKNICTVETGVITGRITI